MRSFWKTFKKPIYCLVLILLLSNGYLFLWKSIRKVDQHSVEKVLAQLLAGLRSQELAIKIGTRKLGSSHDTNFPSKTQYLTDHFVFSLDIFQSRIAEQPVESLGTNLKLTKSLKDEKPGSTKERFNYASFECAAAILEVNPQAKGATAILLESKDQYMWNECASERHVIVELCDDILVDTVVLANYEFFSSVFKDIRISVSDLYPPKGSTGWKILGEFQARNVRDIQVFHISNPLIWARFIRIDFLSHYGNEFICPLSLLRVHGTTMIEEYRRDGESLSETSHTLSSEAISAIQHTLPALEVEITSSLPKIEGPSIRNLEGVTSGVPFNRLKNIDDKALSLDGQSQDENSFNNIKLALSQPIAFSSPVNHEYRQSSGSQAIPSGGTQESIFKTIMKRLNALEQNVSLSYKYLSEQSNAINKVFSDIDGAQKIYLREALKNLNETTMAQLNLLRNTYELVWQAAVHETKLYRESTDEKIEEITRQVHILADEVLLEKRLGVVQLLLLIALVIIVGTSNLIRKPLRIFQKNRVN